MNTPQTATSDYSRAEIETLAGPVMLEFGASWCGYCQAAQPVIHEALRAYASLRHIRIEDGKGKPLGRSYRVTRWPTLIFLLDGQEVARLVRPTDAGAIVEALLLLDSPVS